MNDSDRIQINIRLTATEMQQIRTMSEHYGGVTAVYRIALHDLWDKFLRNQTALAESQTEPADTSEE